MDQREGWLLLISPFVVLGCMKILLRCLEIDVKNNVILSKIWLRLKAVVFGFYLFLYIRFCLDGLDYGLWLMLKEPLTNYHFPICIKSLSLACIVYLLFGLLSGYQLARYKVSSFIAMPFLLLATWIIDHLLIFVFQRYFYGHSSFCGSESFYVFSILFMLFFVVGFIVVLLSSTIANVYVSKRLINTIF